MDKTGQPEFADIFDMEEIQQIQDAFAHAANVASIITAPDGIPITKPSNYCRLCRKIIQKTGRGFQNCMKSTALIGAVSKEGRAVVQPCLSQGLWDGGTGIYFGDRHIATWLIGQVRTEDSDTESIVKYAKVIGADEKEFREALEEVPVMPAEQFAIVAQTLFLTAQMLSRLAFQNVDKGREIERLKQRIRELEKSS
ncbi:MAG: hypothetical protein BWK80_30605 [Desulfobacteraceae bacterium IS3]|nr:MAG: hypothetical protein BWK80_30605 [Desulfobacteraceae bacterium IS3]